MHVDMYTNINTEQDPYFHKKNQKNLNLFLLMQVSFIAAQFKIYDLGNVKSTKVRYMYTS